MSPKQLWAGATPARHVRYKSPMPKRPPGFRCLECREVITEQRFRLHPECAQSRRNRLKRERRAADPHVYETFKCESCGELADRLCETQRTCQKVECKQYLQRIRDERRTDRGPTLSPTIFCEVCGDEQPRRSPTHILCDQPECHRIRSAFNQRENRRLMAHRHWNSCPVCEETVKDTRKTYHPECRRQLRNDKKRVARRREMLRREKQQQLQNKKPRSKPTTPDVTVYSVAI